MVVVVGPVTSMVGRFSTLRWFVFFLLIRLPPRSTLPDPLFPSPPLFRSQKKPMPRPLLLSPDRLFPSDPAQRDIARRLYKEVAGLPIVSPHGHTDPGWFAGNAPFGNAAELLLHPDHYIFRMLYSQGISLDALGIRNRAADPRESRSEEPTSELQSLMRNTYAVF